MMIGRKTPAGSASLQTVDAVLNNSSTDLGVWSSAREDEEEKKKTNNEFEIIKETWKKQKRNKPSNWEKEKLAK